MMSGITSIMIIMPPGRWRDSLLVLLRAIDRICIVGVVDDGWVGWEYVETQAPAAVLLDGGLPEAQVAWLLEHLSNCRPAPRCLVLAHTREQASLAISAGAHVLEAGFSAESLFLALDTLFPASGSELL
jgi:DNA-binding NarL/FixJ family response regulator